MRNVWTCCPSPLRPPVHRRRWMLGLPHHPCRVPASPRKAAASDLSTTGGQAGCRRRTQGTPLISTTTPPNPLPVLLCSMCRWVAGCWNPFPVPGPRRAWQGVKKTQMLRKNVGVRCHKRNGGVAKQAVACLREALAGGGVGGERQVGSLGGTAFLGGAAVCDDGGRLGESRGGRFRALLPEEEGASACGGARATSLLRAAELWEKESKTASRFRDVGMTHGRPAGKPGQPFP